MPKARQPTDHQGCQTPAAEDEAEGAHDGRHAGPADAAQESLEGDHQGGDGTADVGQHEGQHGIALPIGVHPGTHVVEELEDRRALIVRQQELPAEHDIGDARGGQEGDRPRPS